MRARKQEGRKGKQAGGETEGKRKENETGWEWDFHGGGEPVRTSLASLTQDNLLLEWHVVIVF